MKTGAFTSNDFLSVKILFQLSKKQTINKYFQYVTAIRAIRGIRINHLDEVFRLDLQQNLEFYENS